MSVFRVKTADFTTAIKELIPRKGTLDVEFDDGERVSVPVRPLVFHLFFFKIIRKWGLPITKKYLMDLSEIGPGKISQLSTLILNEVRSIHPRNYHGIVFDLMEALNQINRFTVVHTQEYHRSLDIVDLVKITQIPKVKEIISEKLTEASSSVKDNEKFLESVGSRLIAQLRKPHKYNALRPFIGLRFINETQLRQIFHQIGYRTDIDETTIRYPVQGNYLNGLRNSTEFMLESLAAKKSIFYNKESIPTADYFGRRQHLLLSVLSTLHPGDCGSKLYVPKIITKKNRMMLIYQNIVEDGRIIPLDERNIDNYIGKQVMTRSPLSCRHTDGICEVCGGALLVNVTPNIHIGIYSALQATEKIVQVILSSKHQQSTKVVEYHLHEGLKDIMVMKSGMIYTRPKLIDRWKNVQLMIPLDDATQLLTVREVELPKLNSINETGFGNVRNLLLMKKGEPVTEMMNLEDGDQAPRYSRYLIKFISEHPEALKIQDDHVIIDLVDFDFNNPLFRVTSVNAAMTTFVRLASALLENDSTKYSSVTELYNEFSDLVYSQVKVNSIYIEVVLRAIMVTSKYDHRLPVVDDLDNVTFAANKVLNKRRSLGVLCAFQGLKDELMEPNWFVTPKLLTPFDEFLDLRPRL